MTGHTNPFWSPGGPAASPGATPSYVRFVALGDSATSGVGDPVDDGSLRGWARILADAIAQAHHLSYCNVAAAGSTTADVWESQLPDALRHRAHLAALIVGLNDTMRASWDAATVRTHLLMCASALTSRGALLMTVRFHEHARVMRLPGPLATLMTNRLAELNAILDEVHRLYGGIRLDLAAEPEVYETRFWSADRLHPSPLGHRALAARFATLLHEHGLTFPVPTVEHDASDHRPDRPRLDHARWVVTEVIPWLGRRAREIGSAQVSAAARVAWLRLRPDGAA